MKSDVQLPLDAAGVSHHRGRDPAQPVVEAPLAQGAAQDHVWIGGVRRREIKLGYRRDHLDPAGA